MNCIPGLVHFDKPLAIPALFDLFRDNFDDGISIRSSEHFRFFVLRQCEKYASTRHSVLGPTVNTQTIGRLSLRPLSVGLGLSSLAIRLKKKFWRILEKQTQKDFPLGHSLLAVNLG